MNNKKLHDELFKATFSMVSEVIAFSKIYLPKWLDNKLDYSTLQHEPTSFVGEQLSEYFSDIIYSCRLIDGKSIKLTFLLEHKSYVPKNIMEKRNGSGEFFPIILIYQILNFINTFLFLIMS